MVREGRKERKGREEESKSEKVLSSGFVLFFFFFSFSFISWRLITLHYCSGFCHTLT